VTVLPVIVALPVSAAVIAAFLRAPVARRLVAAPRRDRWHDQATPMFGGVGIFAGLCAGVGLAVAAGGVEPTWQFGAIFGGCALLFLAGLADDLLSLGPIAKLAAQGGAAALVLWSGLSVQVVDNDVLAVALGVAWLVGVTNAFNLLDNMDGLAASLAAIACGFLAIDAGTQHPSRVVLVIALGIGLACAGFLPFNLRPKKPAAVFMGDSGSQMLGFALAALSLATSWKVAQSTVATLMLPLLILAIPILDTTLVTITRLLEGRPVHQGGRDHTSHRLVYRGLSEKRAVVLLGLIAAGLGATSLAYNLLNDSRLTLVGVLLTFALLVQFAGFLASAGEQERAERLPERGPAALRLLVLHRRRLIEAVVDFALITASLLIAYLLWVKGSGTPGQRHVFNQSLTVILTARYLVFLPFGLYRGIWRFASANEAARVIGAVATSQLLAVGFLALTIDSFDGFSLEIYVLDALICTGLVGASRFAERGLSRALAIFRDRRTRQRVLIVGAGRGGRSLLRELRESPGEQVVGFVDDDPRLRRQRLQGVLVHGGCSEIGRIIGLTDPDAVLVTIPAAPRERLDAVVVACTRADVPCRFVRRETDLDPLVVLGAGTETEVAARRH
jgi:UDP-GlcNAc:undecaprenyl-phosphate/decaprenyl-phosphate GlcNAc-1-phosphate transferase